MDLSNQSTAEQAAADAAVPRKKRKRRRRWPWALLALVVALPFALRAALPTIVERGAAYGSRYWLGLPVRIDNADFALLDGTVVLEGVTIGAAPDGVAPKDAAMHPPPIESAGSLLHLDRIAARLSWQALREHKVHLFDLTVDAPSLNVLRESDGAIAPLRHAVPLAPPSAKPKPAAASEPAQPWPVEVERFELRAPDIEILDPASKENLLKFSLETFALNDIGIRGSAFALGGVDVEGPVLRVRRDLIIAKPAGEPAVVTADVASPAPAASGAAAPAPVTAQPSAAAAAPAPGYRIEKIDIARASFIWVTDKGPLDVALSLKASNVTADEGKRFPIDLQLEIDKGSIGLAGDVGILPPSYTGTVKWSGLPFPPLLLASLPDLASWLHSADSTGDLTVDADIAGVKGPPALRMSGRAAIATLAVSNPGNEEVSLGWKQLEVEMKELVVPLPEKDKPARTTVANLDLVRLTEPKIRYTHPSPALNAMLGIPAAAPPATSVNTAGKPASDSKKGTAATTTAKNPESSPAPPPASGKGTPPVDVTVAALELDAGDMQVVDTTVSPPVTSYLRNLDVSAKDFHFPDPSAKEIRVRAILPKTSSLAIDGNLAAGNNGDFTIALKQLDLPVFSPYAAAGGASLDAGEVSVTTKLKLRGANMQIDNDLVLRRFGVSLHDPSSFNRDFGMPIDLALALLRDPAGDIRLTIPVKVDEKGASVSMGAIIASALKAALIGAVTAPLKLLGAAFGGHDNGGTGGLAIAPIASQAGLAELSPDAPARADSLASLLKQRPSMALVLSGRTGEADKPMLAEQLLAEQIKAGKALPDVEGSSFLARRRISKVLEARAAAPELRKNPPAELSPDDRTLFDRCIAATNVPADRYDALAKTRAEKARELLVAKAVDPSRIAIAARDADGDPAVSISFSSTSAVSTVASMPLAAAGSSVAAAGNSASATGHAAAAAGHAATSALHAVAGAVHTAPPAKDDSAAGAQPANKPAR